MKIKLENWCYHVAGIIFLIFAKTKYNIHGYSTPKPFPIDEYDKCIEYELNVVDNWLSFLKEYLGTDVDNLITDKNILELGPGSDLGAGLYLLSKGAARYNAIDINKLVESVPKDFYELFFQHLKDADIASNIEFLRNQLEKWRSGSNDRLNYICREDFDILSALGKQKIDIVFGQAAFEHFDNIENTVKQLTLVTKPNAIILAEIDLKTHSRWICDKDPNNIYRYISRFYNLFRFKGFPNRIRPYVYKSTFEKYGWENVRITPLITLKNNDFRKVKHSLAKAFQGEQNQMN